MFCALCTKKGMGITMEIKSKTRANVAKLSVSIFCLAFILSTTNIAFATQLTNSEQTKSNKIANQIVDLVGNDNIVNNMYETSNKYIPTTTTDISIPKTGDAEVHMAVGDDDIRMSLPDEVAGCEGMLTEQGHVVYDSQNDVDVIVQATEEGLENDEIRNTVKTIICIGSKDAPKEYSFDYNLPTGCSLMMGSELGNDEIPSDAVGIINKDGYAISIIDSPWAKDAFGKNIPTFYRIEGDTLVQTVTFDQDTQFPVTADPSTIVDSRVRTASHEKATGWRVVDGQGPKGYAFLTGGAMGWFRGEGTSKSLSINSTLTNGALSINFNMGIIKTSTSGGARVVNFPPSTIRKVIIANIDFKITEKTQDYKYKNTKVTDNGKTTTTTYKWVTVRNWVDKVTELGASYGLRAV